MPTSDPKPRSEAQHDGRWMSRPPQIPRWVILFGVAVAVLVLLMAAMMLLGGGQHGPDRHDPNSNTSAPYAVAAHP